MPLLLQRWYMFMLGFVGGIVMCIGYLNAASYIDDLDPFKSLRSEPLDLRPPQFSITDDFCKDMTPLKNLSIAFLAELVRAFQHSDCSTCRGIHALFNSIFTLTVRVSDLQLEPVTFKEKMAAWLGNNQATLNEAEHQRVVFIRNDLTMEETIINTLREKRPITPPAVSEHDYVEKLADEGKPSCDFCNYTKATGYDMFGRIVSVSSYTASNAFKFDKIHSMSVFRSHHPHQWSSAEFMDVFETAKLWFHRAFEAKPSECYPQILWDLMPRSSASQVHPHVHMTLNSEGYYGELEKWKRVGDEYTKKKNSANYYDDLFTLHRDFHLAAKHESAVVIAHLTPRRDNELVIMGPAMNEDFLQLLYYISRVFIEDLEKLALSCAIALPPLAGCSSDMPAIARIVTRGIVHEIRSDVSSLELFAASNVNLDPFSVARRVFPAIKKRAEADGKTVHIF